MITLTIKKSDGSSYWTERFNSQAECDKWLSEEKTRHYWEHDLAPWSATSVAAPMPVVDPAVEAAAQTKKAQQVAARNAVKALDTSKLKTLPDAADAITKIIQALGLDQ
jgi:hypothetical protein